MRLCNARQSLALKDVSLVEHNLSLENSLEEENVNNNQETICHLNNNSSLEKVDTQESKKNQLSPESEEDDKSSSDDELKTPLYSHLEPECSDADDNGNNRDCGDNSYCEHHVHKNFYDNPKYQEPSLNYFFPYPASFVVQTSLLPVCGVAETTILPEDSSPSPDSEGMEDLTDACGKLAKDTANERKIAEEGMRKKDLINDPWLPQGKPNLQKKSGDNAAFKVYNIETTLPKFDVEAIESYLKQSKKDETRVSFLFINSHVGNRKMCCMEVVLVRSRLRMEEKNNVAAGNMLHLKESCSPMPKNWSVQDREHILQRFNNISRNSFKERRRNDREEIRRRLAMGDDIAAGRKPSLQARLQGGMNLQICFMNEIGNESDTESSSPPSPLTVVNAHTRPNSLPLKNVQVEPPVLGPPGCLGSETNLAACQARLQAEARHALMQADEMARMQMQIERQRVPISPITQMVRNSLIKVGVSFNEDRRRLSRQLLTEMNVAQLQIIINDLHSQIELLNEELVQLLVSRDDLHMEQDSMLVDIEDLTRYINAKCVQEEESRDVSA